MKICRRGFDSLGGRSAEGRLQGKNKKTESPVGKIAIFVFLKQNNGSFIFVVVITFRLSRWLSESYGVTTR